MLTAYADVATVIPQYQLYSEHCANGIDLFNGILEGRINLPSCYTAVHVVFTVHNMG